MIAMFRLTLLLILLSTATSLAAQQLTDPVASLDNEKVKITEFGTATPEDFSLTKGIHLLLPDDELSSNWLVASYHLVKVPGRGDPVEVVVKGGGLNEPSENLIKTCASGDTYYFENIIAEQKTAAGEVLRKKLNSLVVKVKP